MSGAIPFQASTPDSPTYEAGVVEFSHERNESFTPEQRLESNLAGYLKILNEAPEDLDIIVFPEMTLNDDISTAVETPEPTANESPCDSSTYPNSGLLSQISCSAKAHKRYVVVDIVTKVDCPDADMTEFDDPRNCSDRPDSKSYYNTNVVFDRNGILIARYRKFNLFGEEVDKPFKPRMISFDTDFGVKFGTFICFDLMFRHPALEMLKDSNVTDIVFTTMWYSEAPFLTAVQVQQNWAFSNDVNLLAAGANNPAVGSTGTGIYSGRRGSLTSVMEGSSSSKLYVATVPKKTPAGDAVNVDNKSTRYSKDQMKPLKLKRDQLDNYTFKFLIPLFAEGSETIAFINGNETLCSNGICCDFKFRYGATRMTNNPYYRMALAVYHGNRTFDGFADGGVIACAVIACQTQNIATCGIRNETLEFVHPWTSLEISGSFPHGDQFFYLPTTLDEAVMPFDVDEFDYQLRQVQWNK